MVAVAAVGILVLGLLNMFHIRVNKLVLLFQLFMIAGVLLLPFSLGKRLLKARPVQKVFLISLWVGILLASVGQFIRMVDRSYYLSSGLAVGARMAGIIFILVAAVIYLVTYLVPIIRRKPLGKPLSSETAIALGIDQTWLEDLSGTYTNDEAVLSIVITHDGETLIARATAQAAFYLEALEDKYHFKYPGREIRIEFKPDESLLILEQHGGFFPFKREN